jgi:Holliday junction resolvasome RuvABC DNA-binding subunit
MLEDIAALLQLRGDNPFRVGAYRRAAVSIRHSKESLAGIFERDGLPGLERMAGIGTSLARKIGDMLRNGESKTLERLRRKHAREDVLVTLPTVGKRLAERIRSTLGAESLEEVLAAAEDGRLRRVEGLGRKRVEAIRDSLLVRLGDRPRRRRLPDNSNCSVELLLEIDREYRDLAAGNRLPKAAPQRFNPTGAAWLPILRVERHGRHFTAHFANTANSHRFGHVRDWVVIRSDDKSAFGVWTVVTAARGECRGKRVVKGRERECQDYYRSAKTTQLRLPSV